jgi:hypothetical protein
MSSLAREERRNGEPAAEDLQTQRLRSYAVRDLWTEEPSEATLPLPLRRDAGAESDEAVRAAWIRVMAKERGLDERQAARLWDSDPPLVPKDLFAAGFHAGDAALHEKDRQLAIATDDLRHMGKQIEALLIELEERYAEARRLEDEIEGARRALRAASVITAAATRAETASEPARLQQIASAVLFELGLPVESRPELSPSEDAPTEEPVRSGDR